MKKTLVIYWSGTGNTEAMANAVVDGVSCGEAPDDEAIAAGKARGKLLAE